MSFVVEEESGIVRTDAHPHNGYYAGSFSDQPFRAPWDLATAAPWTPESRRAA